MRAGHILGIAGAVLLVLLACSITLAVIVPAGIGNWRDAVASREEQVETSGDRNTEVTQPTSQPEPTKVPEEVYAEGKANRDGNAVELFVINPEAPTQQQQRHPTVYEETRVSSVPVTFDLDVPVGYIAIVGGWEVDGVDNGVYRAFGPGHQTVTIVDGFALLIEEEWGQAEFDFRVEQAEQLGWAHNTVDPGPLQ
jgi:hypothetical protein